jgi:hypothetical protein
MNSGTAKKLEDENAERERAAQARFASELLGHIGPGTWTPNTVFTPDVMLGTSTTSGPGAAFDVGLGLAKHLQTAFASLHRYAILSSDDMKDFADLRLADTYTRVNLARSGAVVLHAPPGVPQGIFQVVHNAGLTCNVVGVPNLLVGDLSPPEDPVIVWRDDRARAALEAIDSSLGDLERFDGVRSRLKELVAIATEEYPESDIPRPVALEVFALFIRDFELHNMHLSLTPGGHLIAEWRAGDGRRAAFQFLPDRTVNFSARIPDPAKGGRPMPIYGATSLDGLYGRVLDDAAFSWVIDEAEPRDTAADPG